jgi:AAHS family 3-hydroxyphenylpropionic acid transporter
MEIGHSTKELKTWRVLILCAIVILLEGFDIQVAGVSATKLAPYFRLNSGQLGIFLGASAVGIFIAAAFGGVLADKFGRKPVLVTGVTIFGLFALSTLWATGFEMLCVTRFLTGLGLGAAMPIVIAYASDYSPVEMKKRAVGFIYCAIPIGGLLSGVVMQSGTFGSNWQSAYWVGGLAPLIFAPFLYFLLPTQIEVKTKEDPSGVPKLGIVSGLFGNGKSTLTGNLWIATFGTLLVMYLLLGWMPSLLVKMGLSKSAAQYLQMIYNFGSSAGAALAGYLLDKKLLYSTVSGAYLGLAALLAIFGFGKFDYSAVALLAAGLGFTVTVAQAAIYAFAPLCYAESVRNTGVGAAVAAGRLGTSAGPLLAGSLLGAGRAAADVLKVLIPIILIAGLMALLVVKAFRGEHPGAIEGLKTSR